MRWEHAGADVASGGDPRRKQEQQHARCGGQQQDQGVGAGEGAHFLSPPERGRPPQPAGAAGGIGDHSQRQEQAHRPPAELERHSARRGELARERPESHEHGHDRRGRERELDRPAGRQAGKDKTGELRDPKDEDARGDRGQREISMWSHARPVRRARAPYGRCPPRSAAHARRPAVRRPRRRWPAFHPHARLCSRRR